MSVGAPAGIGQQSLAYGDGNQHGGGSFLLIYIIRVRHRGIYQPYVKNSRVSKISSYTTVITVMLMAYGTFNYIWADMTMYYLFWCVFGLGSAVLRVAKSEFDDRVAYFSDGSAEDSSSIDISIR